MEIVNQSVTFKKNTHFINKVIRCWPGFRKTDKKDAIEYSSTTNNVIRKKQFIFLRNRVHVYLIAF